MCLDLIRYHAGNGVASMLFDEGFGPYAICRVPLKTSRTSRTLEIFPELGTLLHDAHGELLPIPFRVHHITVGARAVAAMIQEAP